MSLFKGLNILIVDDEKLLREMLVERLELEGIKCEEAEDGLIAFEKVQKKDYDFVISDIRTPRASGLDLLNMIKEKGVIAPKIILMTAFTDLNEKSAINLGAVGFILKPKQAEDLLDIIESNLD